MNKKSSRESRRNYRGNIDGTKVIEERKKRREELLIKSNRDRNKLIKTFKKSKKLVRFDYSDNVFSFRGDWSTRIKVVKLFFPFLVDIDKCKNFEELVIKDFEKTFLET